MAKTGTRRRRRDGGDWLLLTEQLRRRGRGLQGPPASLWLAAICDRDGEPLGASIHVRRERAIAEAAARPLAVARPARILIEEAMAGEAASIARVFGAPVEQVGAGDHEETRTRFHDEARFQAQSLADQRDADSDEIDGLAELLEVATHALVALDGDRDLYVAATLVGPDGGVPLRALVACGTVPALMYGAEDDEAALRDAAQRGTAPVVPSVALVFAAANSVDPVVRQSVTALGWRDPRIPVVQVTDEDGGAARAGLREIRELTCVVEALLAGGLGAVARGRLGTGRVIVDVDRRRPVIWDLGDAAGETAGPTLH